MSRDGDSDPAKILPVLLERTGAMREDIAVLTALLREMDSRMRHIETERSRVPQNLEERLLGLEQWRRDQEVAAAATTKVKEPYARLWWLGVGGVVVMAMTGFAVVMWRIVVAGTTAGR